MLHEHYIIIIVFPRRYNYPYRTPSGLSVVTTTASQVFLGSFPIAAMLREHTSVLLFAASARLHTRYTAPIPQTLHRRLFHMLQYHVFNRIYWYSILLLSIKMLHCHILTSLKLNKQPNPLSWRCFHAIIPHCFSPPEAKPLTREQSSFDTIILSLNRSCR